MNSHLALQPLLEPLSRRRFAASVVTLSGGAGAACGFAQADDFIRKEHSTMTPTAPHDFDFLYGSWRVRHSRLLERLAGKNDWEEFDGSCVAQPMLGGLGNVDDNVMNPAGGSYRALSVRAFDDRARTWAIWWLSALSPHTIDAPVIGRFEGGVGIFEGDDSFAGKPIRVRYRWSDTRTPSPRWEQSFSADGGKTWEVNWRMVFARASMPA